MRHSCTLGTDEASTASRYSGVKLIVNRTVRGQQFVCSNFDYVCKYISRLNQISLNLWRYNDEIRKLHLYFWLASKGSQKKHSLRITCTSQRITSIPRDTRTHAHIIHTHLETFHRRKGDCTAAITCKWAGRFFFVVNAPRSRLGRGLFPSSSLSVRPSTWGRSSC